MFIRFESSTDVDIDFFIQKSDFYIISEDRLDFYITERDWNKYVMLGGTSIIVDVICTVRLNNVDKTVEDFEVEEVYGLTTPHKDTE